MPRITTRNARFQQWRALLDNRKKRNRQGEFLVQGVRPISLVVAAGWPIRALVHTEERRLSAWAQNVLDEVSAPRFAMADDLLAELGEKATEIPELVAVAALPEDDLSRIPVSSGFCGVVFDRPTSPGNIGTLVRSADAFGADGVIVTGHSADAYDPKAVRASTGSLFGIPVVRVPSHREVMEWVHRQRGAGTPIQVTGSDEQGTVEPAVADLSEPVLLVVGNETVGLSAAWREVCDTMMRIPMAGTASSLNAASAATVVLYEMVRQRGGPPAQTGATQMVAP
ncbi:TrmH family RNA methyltransferase [Lipingzhangella sp. LS1_29]|uniref:TrmH family RNA methyltransferase n=1 Tax=Lipingzhangella rawalii TaxID=2055835 RepID=A0ABU2H1W8_9ACTN|nr:TrmH family RNA methyltransferase [Lipingzhangella rawalii]MDS1269281.1 TrmH family RNA methyltransferase [Lipingzhangella rawalii]